MMKKRRERERGIRLSAIETTTTTAVISSLMTIAVVKEVILQGKQHQMVWKKCGDRACACIRQYKVCIFG